MNTSFETNFDETKGETSNIWFTPKYILESLDKFDLDPCTSTFRPFDTAHNHLTPAENGLTEDFNKYKNIWLNPPYGTYTGKWVSKLCKSQNGIVLIFNRSDTPVWHDIIFPYAHSIFYIKGRISFINQHGKKGSGAGSPSVLVAFGKYADDQLKKCNLKGTYNALCTSPYYTEQKQISMPF
jgi:hypothetical protein